MTGRAAIAALLVLALASAAAPAPRKTSARAETEVRDAMRRYNRLVLNMRADSIAATYLPDGEMRDRGRTIARGPDAIRTFLASFEGKVRVESNLTDVTAITLRADTAFASCFFRQAARILSDSSRVEASGHLDATWVRTKQGWRIRLMESGPLTAADSAAIDSSTRSR